MDRILALLVPLCIAAVGLIALRRRVALFDERVAFARDFSSRFMQFFNTGARDEHAYVALTKQVHRMQRELGRAGVLEAYKPPGANYLFRNYPVLLNLLPELYSAARDPILSRRIAGEYGTALRDVLLRHEGYLEDAQAALHARASSPLQWFVEGARLIVSAPVRVLAAFDIIGEGGKERALGSWVFRVSAAIAGLAAFGASLMTIVTGWEASKQLLSFMR